MKSVFTAIPALFMFIAVMSSHAMGLKYHDASLFPLYGTAAPDASKRYSRLPDSLENKIRPELWALGLNSAGMSIRFATDASEIGMRWKSLNKFAMNHMTATGVRGLDLYVMRPDSSWTTLSSVRPRLNEATTSCTVMSGMTREMREYMLFLPLYDGVDSIYIGIDSLATIRQPAIDLPARDKPIVMYGTSIMQGGCATRPGMAHTNILQRDLNREVYNLGFSGNAKLDVEIAELMASIDAGVYVIDPLPNLKTQELKDRIDLFFHTIRDVRPDTPVLFVESPIFPLMRFNQETMSTITEKNDALKAYFATLTDSGTKNIYYFKGEDILGDMWEGTVDNYHLTDMGFQHFAEKLLPVLKTILNEQ